jgi:hypothetical protein
MGQVNVNPPSSGPVVTNDGGFGAGMIIGIILLILIVLVLVVYAGPQIFKSGSSPAPNVAPTTAPTVAPTKTLLDTLYIA